ncbi:RNA recognition motif domain-containing protein [Bowmanella dokdonensis]|uniref:RNA-binding protein n=1 Tax=Bowmanella dokdonensis TaxID=751969 RepID=A0A939DRE4_9ALTE|nr:RNA-binding protein [Bowmanella dokdonensis]MBN7827405.1 RNA-binding protein [Bowmanella dokdonensis]
MKSPVLLYIVIAGLLAVLGFFVMPANAVSSNQALALGLAVGGIATPILAKLLVSSSVPSASSSSHSTGSTESRTLYVGNLPYRASEEDVKEHFEIQGSVLSVRLMKDRRTGKRKGYGFVEMPEGDAEKAIRSLNDTEFQERTLKVRMAKDKQED